MTKTAIKKANNRPKVLVAMSGGVDSSVTAHLLIKQGYEVEGVHFRLITKDSGLEKARTVAKFLKIPYRVIDLRKDFESKVIKPFLREYRANKTPNPCVICNPKIKFGKLFQITVKEKFDYFATGHYVRVEKSDSGVKLLKGLDKNKDQSYFLWGLSQKYLAKAIFPLGTYTKSEIKVIAKEIGLPYYAVTAKKSNDKIKESQEVCFAQEGVGCFLKKNIKKKQGNIVSDTGDVLGRHGGLFLYTIGQRKGLNLPNGPYFVLSKDPAKNELVVTKDEKSLFANKLTVKNINWVNGLEPMLPLLIMLKTRYRQSETAAQILKSDRAGICKILLINSHKAIAPGQSAVFYKNQELIGGGIIT